MGRHKQQLHHQAKKTGIWTNYRAFQKECKRAHRKAEWEFTNKSIEEGMATNNTKPFWKYIKSKKQENIGVSSLKSEGKLYSDSTSKANILLKQFSSVFTRGNQDQLPTVSKRIANSITNIKIRPEGVESLQKKVNISKASGPNNIPNRLLKNVLQN